MISSKTKEKKFIPSKPCFKSWNCEKLLTKACTFKHDEEQLKFAKNERSNKKYKQLCEKGIQCSPKLCEYLHLKPHYDLCIMGQPPQQKISFANPKELKEKGQNMPTNNEKVFGPKEKSKIDFVFCNPAKVNLKQDSDEKKGPPPKCKNRNECKFLLEGACKNMHSDHEIHFAESERTKKNSKNKCKKGSDCADPGACKFLHSEKDYNEFEEKEICKFGWKCEFALRNECKNKHTKEQIQYALSEISKKKNKIICKKGNHCAPDKCDYLHFQPDYNDELANVKEELKEKKTCKYGWECLNLLSDNKCIFFHSDEEIYFANNEKNSKQTTKVCKLKEKCERLADDLCKNLHFKSDYEQLIKPPMTCKICFQPTKEFYSFSSCTHQLCLSCFKKLASLRCPYCKVNILEPVVKYISDFKIFRVFIKLSNERIVGAVVENDDLVSKLQAILIEKKIPFNDSQIKYSYLGKPLKPDFKLSAYGIEGGSVILANILGEVPKKTKEEQPKNVSESYSVFLNPLEGGSITINVSSSDKVTSLIKTIENKTGIKTNQLRFSFNGKTFSGDEDYGDLTLEKIYLRKNSVIHLLLRLQGGSDLVLVQSNFI